MSKDSSDATQRKIAAAASKILTSKTATRAEKAVAASALTQLPLEVRSIERVDQQTDGERRMGMKGKGYSSEKPMKGEKTAKKPAAKKGKK